MLVDATLVDVCGATVTLFTVMPPPPAPYGLTSAEIPRDEPALAAPLRAPTDGVDLSDLGLEPSDKLLYESTIDMVAACKGRITKVVHQNMPSVGRECFIVHFEAPMFSMVRPAR